MNEILSKSESLSTKQHLLFQALANHATRSATASDAQKFDDAWEGVETFPVVLNGRLYELHRDNVTLGFGCGEPQIIGVQLSSGEETVTYSPARLFDKNSQFLILAPELVTLGVQ